MEPSSGEVDLNGLKNFIYSIFVGEDRDESFLNILKNATKYIHLLQEGLTLRVMLETVAKWGRVADDSAGTPSEEGVEQVGKQTDSKTISPNLSPHDDGTESQILEGITYAYGDKGECECAAADAGSCANTVDADKTVSSDYQKGETDKIVGQHPDPREKELEAIFLNFRINQPWRLSPMFLRSEVAFHAQNIKGISWRLAQCSVPPKSGADMTEKEGKLSNIVGKESNETEKKSKLLVRRFLLGEEASREKEIKSMLISAMNNCPHDLGSAGIVGEKLNDISRLGFPNRWKKAKNEFGGETEKLVSEAVEQAKNCANCVEVEAKDKEFCINEHLKGNTQGNNAARDLVLLLERTSYEITRTNLWNLAHVIREGNSPLSQSWLDIFKHALRRLSCKGELLKSLIASVIYFPEQVPGDLEKPYILEILYPKKNRYAQIMKQLEVK
jgi:predicted hydrocarbon binding protein